MNELPRSNVVPYLTVEDAKGIISFYAKAFGAREVMRQETPDGTKILHAALVINDGLVMLSDDFPEMNGCKARTAKALGGTPIMVALTVPDADATWEKATGAGAKVVMPLADQFWGDRFGILEDPAGIRWSLSTPKTKVTAEELRAGAEKTFGGA
jgi:PhnB protein